MNSLKILLLNATDLLIFLGLFIVLDPVNKTDWFTNIMCMLFVWRHGHNTVKSFFAYYSVLHNNATIKALMYKPCIFIVHLNKLFP